MASLSDVNSTLIEQNDSLKVIAQSTLATQGLILKQIQQSTGFKAIEEQRESQKGFSIRGAADGAKKGIQDTGKKLGGLGGKLGNFLSGAGIAGLAGTFGSVLLKRGIPALLVTAFSNNIADYLAGPDGDKEVKDQIEKAVTGGALGYLVFGLKGAVVGALLGALMTDENKKKLEELGTALKEQAKELDLKLPPFKTVMESITKTFGGTLDFFTNIVKGDFLKAFNENLDELILTVGGLFLLFKPGKTISLAIKAISSTVGAAITALTVAGSTGSGAVGSGSKDGKVVKSNAGNLKVSGVDGKATTIDPPKGSKEGDRVAKNLQKFPKMMKFLNIARGMGPIAGILGVANIVQILASPGDISSKVDEIAGALGGAAGSVALGAAGGAVLGSFGGPAAIAGSVLGGIGGYFAGESLAKGLAQFLLDQPVDAFPKWSGINKLLNSFGGGSTDASSSSIGQSSTVSTSNAGQQQYRPGTGGVSESINSAALETNTAMANQPAVIMQDNSAPQVNNVSSSSTPIVAPMVNNTDVNDSLVVNY